MIYQFSILTLLAAIGVAASPSTAAQNRKDQFPDRPIQIVVPFPAGAANDYTARLIGQNLSDVLSVPVIVENKTGASGLIAADSVAAAPADGYHLLLGTVSLVTQPTLTGRPTYIPERLIPLGVAVDQQLALVARSDLAAHDVDSMMAASAGAPGGLNAASAGSGTLSHLGWEILRKETGTIVNHVPYRGSTPAMTDLIAGHADVMIDTITSALPHLLNGKIKALAALTPERLAALPEVATVSEQGYPWLGFSAWNAFMVPAGTPPEVIRTLHEALTKAIERPEVAGNLRDRGLLPVVLTPAGHLEFIQQEAQRWNQVLRDADVKS
ncbi:MAG: Bug family tripartite tricarboxylate transporter substrate binding protein [Pigmentiphaga sp.]